MRKTVVPNEPVDETQSSVHVTVTPGYEAFACLRRAVCGICREGAVVKDGGSTVFENISSVYAWLEYDIDVSDWGEISGELIAVSGAMWV